MEMIFFTLFVTLLFITRFVYVIWRSLSNRTINNKRGHGDLVKTAIVVGSGGHTAEILRIVQNLNPRFYHPRAYIMASSDVSSEAKIRFVEKQLADGGSAEELSNCYSIVKVPRSRNVKQSYLTSVFTTLYSCLACLPIMWHLRPKLLICNGPGTCIPICVIAFLMNVFWVSDTVIIYIESICRVKTLSLSGKILYYFADEFFVQWKDLHNKYKRTKYFGRLV